MKTDKAITFGVDKIKISGPNADGGYTITMYTGEYAQDDIVKLLKIPQQTSCKVSVEVEE